MSSSSSKDTESREELEKLHDECKVNDNHKWEVARLIVCSVCGMYQDEYDDRKK